MKDQLKAEKIESSNQLKAEKIESSNFTNIQIQDLQNQIQNLQNQIQNQFYQFKEPKIQDLRLQIIGNQIQELQNQIYQTQIQDLKVKMLQYQNQMILNQMILNQNQIYQTQIQDLKIQITQYQNPPNANQNLQGVNNQENFITNLVNQTLPDVNQVPDKNNLFEDLKKHYDNFNIKGVKEILTNKELKKEKEKIIKMVKERNKGIEDISEMKDIDWDKLDGEEVLALFWFIPIMNKDTINNVMDNITTWLDNNNNDKYYSFIEDIFKEYEEGDDIDKFKNNLLDLLISKLK